MKPLPAVSGKRFFSCRSCRAVLERAGHGFFKPGREKNGIKIKNLILSLWDKKQSMVDIVAKCMY
jgi:hypothetical protein